MAYKQSEIETVFNSIIEDIEHGYALRTVLKNGDKPSSRTFYKWLESDEDKVKRYARACEERAANIFEDILKIADNPVNGVEITTYPDGTIQAKEGDMIAHRRLQVDARKWMLAKMQPEKYGDKNTTVLEGSEKAIKISFKD